MCRSKFSQFALILLCSLLIAPLGGSSLLAENKVLFLGNSFTIGGSKSVPEIFDALAIAAGHEDPLTVMRAVGGRDFAYHHANSLSYIKQEAWTHVVMQNYSTRPTHIGNVAAHMANGALLYADVIANNPNTQVHLYMTWARAEAHSLISGTSTNYTFATTDEMLDELRSNYYALAATLTANNPDKPPVLVNPVGDAWNHAGGNLPSSDPNFFDLFASDNYHGNDRGYYLSACVHYASIYRSSPVGLFETPTVSGLGLTMTAAEAAYLEHIAWITVLDTDLIDSPILLDFGADSQKSVRSTLPGATWNNMTESLATVPGASIKNLLSRSGQMTQVDLSIVAPFNSAESSGTTHATEYPDTATQDALYGNTTQYNGQSNVAPIIKLSDLDPNQAYRLSFYASRNGGTDNYQTRYSCTGDRSLFVELNPQGNLDTLVQTDSLYPDLNNEIRIALTAGPENNNAEGLIYLGILRLDQYMNPQLSITSQPTSVTVEANTKLQLSAAVDATRPVTAQWRRDGVPIPGATDLKYTIDPVTANLDGSVYSVLLDNGVFSLESTGALLTVIEDRTPPAVESFVRLDSYSLMLTFSEGIASEGALPPKAYRIVNEGNVLEPSSINLSADGKTVTLVFNEALTGNIVALLSDELEDMAGNAFSDAEKVQKLVSPNGKTIYIDFASSSSVTGGDTWNQVSLPSSVRTTVGNGTGTAHVFFNDLQDATGTSTNIKLLMSDSMTSTNSSGTSDGPYPSGATKDSLFGQDTSWNGYIDNGQAVFHFSNLDADTIYDFTFYASRLNVSDNRETRYQLKGANSSSVDLDPAGNTDQVAKVSGIHPDASGEIELCISKGPNNNNSEGFYYLGAMQIDVRNAIEAQVFRPVKLGNTVIIDWIGAGSLQWTNDLTKPWKGYMIEPVAPTIESPLIENQRFYRLSN